MAAAEAEVEAAIVVAVAVATRQEAVAVTPSAAAMPAAALISQDRATILAALREDFMAGPRAGFTAEATRATVLDLPAMATQPAGAAGPGAAAFTGAVGAEPAGAAVTGAAASGPGRSTAADLPGFCQSYR